MMQTVVIGIDPSLSGFGIADGKDAIEIATLAADTDTDRSPGDVLVSRIATIDSRLCKVLEANDRGCDVLVAVEAPLLRGIGSGSHLYEVGWLMAMIYDATYTTVGRERGRVIEVPIGTVRKQLFGRGNIGKTEIPVAVLRKFGVSFDRDPKLNKLEAWCLWRFGCDFRDGLVTVTNSRRGRGEAERRGQARRAGQQSERGAHGAA